MRYSFFRSTMRYGLEHMDTIDIRKIFERYSNPQRPSDRRVESRANSERNGELL